MSTTSPIPPTIGRVVLVRSSMWGGDAPALVTQVNNNDNINVCVMPNGEAPYPRMSVPYAEDHDASGFVESFHWMDYQRKVAAERDPETGASLPGDITGAEASSGGEPAAS